ncbi:unnamed protein product, partial [Darwinula stevensoni]
MQLMDHEEYPDDLNPFGDDDAPESNQDLEENNCGTQEGTNVTNGVVIEAHDRQIEDGTTINVVAVALSSLVVSDTTNISDPALAEANHSDANKGLSGETQESSLFNRSAEYDDSLNPFSDSDDGYDADESSVVSQSGDQSLNASPVRPRRKKRVAPLPPSLREGQKSTSPPSVVKSARYRPGMQEDHGKNSSKGIDEDNQSDISGTGSPTNTMKMKKKPAPPAPVPPKRSVSDEARVDLEQDLADIHIHLEQLERQHASVKEELAHLQDKSLDNGNKDEEDVSRSEKTPEVDPSVISEKIRLAADINDEMEELKWKEKEAQLMLQELDLEVEQAELEHKIRIFQAQASRLRTDADRKEEEECLSRLLNVVSKRNSLIEALEKERSKCMAHDVSVTSGEEGQTGKRRKHKLKLKSKALRRPKTSLHKRQLGRLFLAPYNRQLGFNFPLGFRDRLASNFYSSLLRVGSWNHLDEVKFAQGPPGGIFNLEFSPDGQVFNTHQIYSKHRCWSLYVSVSCCSRYLVAACEGKCMLMFDPLTRSQIAQFKDCHSDCVNCVKFLDSRIFATCSDDTTVALWDVRNLSSKLRTLKAHTNWVKNIEYDQNEKLLVTSDLDGNIFAWDVNGYSEDGLAHERVFKMSHLMRMRLNPDASKMILCTKGGYMMVIHNLSLPHMATDLVGFKPNLYRVMQLTGQSWIPMASAYSHLFNAKRNRVEIISDFPHRDDAEVISSLQVHPQGWCVLTRNTSSDEHSEVKYPKQFSYKKKPVPRFLSRDDPRRQTLPPARYTLQLTSSELLDALLEFRRWGWEQGASNSEGSNNSNDRRNSDNPQNNDRVHSNEGAVGAGPGPGPSLARNALRRRVAFVMQTGNRVEPRTLLLVRPPRNLPPHSNSLMDAVVPPSYKIQKNFPRLTHFIEESNVGNGFIKELCFSADGRVIFSPFGNGVRMLSFGPSCEQLCHCVPTKPTRLSVLMMSICHSSTVVSTKFSPTHYLLVSGCLD